MISLIEFHKEIVEMESCEDVEDVRSLIVERLVEAGESPEVDGAGNIIASKGSGSPHYVLNTHFDTVPPHIEYEDKGEKIIGRGACDAKGPLATFVKAFVELEDIDGTVTLALTPDEETTTDGAQSLTEYFDSPDGFLIGEPTGLDVCVSAKGYFEGRIDVEGVAAHSSTPEAGVNAITEASRIVSKLGEYDDFMGVEEHPELGQPVLAPTIISGGEAVNQIPDSCVIHFSRRGVPPETEEGFRENISSYLSGYVSDGVEFSVSGRGVPFLEPFETDSEDMVVQTFLDCGGRDVRAFTAATEASHFASFDVPIVIFGPGYISDSEGAVAHSEREYVPRSELKEAYGVVSSVLEELV